MLVLLTLFACAPESDDSADTSDGGGDAVAGAELFGGTCKNCHGADGTGGVDISGTHSADLTVRAPALSDAELADRIENGFGTAMPSQFTDPADVADVIAYLRDTFP